MKEAVAIIVHSLFYANVRHLAMMKKKIDEIAQTSK